MNETIHPDHLSDAPLPNGDHRGEVPGTAKLPGSEKAPPAVVGLLMQAVKGAHDTIDRLADRAAPAAQHLGDGLAAVEEVLGAKSEQLRETRDAWAESARNTVRKHPLACVAAAVVLGVVISRLVRVSR